MDFSGRMLGSADEDTCNVHVWDLARHLAKEERVCEVSEDSDLVLTGHEEEVNCLRFAGRALLASGSSDGSVRLWDVSSGATTVGRCLRVLRGFTGGKVWSVDVGRRRVAAAGRRGMVGVWAVEVEDLGEEGEEDKKTEFAPVPVPHDSATALGQALLLDGGTTLLTADGMAAVAITEFWWQK